MAEYIERETLLKDIEESVVFTVRQGQPSLEMRGANKITDRIKSAPTADVVEVVRCKDCKHKGWVQEPCHGKTIDFCKLHEFCIRETDFCSYGEKRSEDK